MELVTQLRKNHPLDQDERVESVTLLDHEG